MIKALFLFCLLWATPALAFQTEYFVTGTNLTTGERVIGWLDGTLGKPEAQGYVLDHGDYYEVIGSFSGKGLFSLRSLCCEYEVEVTDEVTNSKAKNRRAYQKEWK